MDLGRGDPLVTIVAVRGPAYEIETWANAPDSFDDESVPFSNPNSGSAGWEWPAPCLVDLDLFHGLESA